MSRPQHDPLCPLVKLSVLKSGCPQCDLIRKGRSAGVQAARDAVAALCMGDSGEVDLDYALAAIDALRGEA